MEQVIAESMETVYQPEVVAEDVLVSTAGDADELSTLVAGWNSVIDRISRIVPLMRSSLVDTIPLSVTEERVLIGCDVGFSEDLANFSQHHNNAIVARVIGEFLKRKIVVEFEAAEISNLLAAKTAVEKNSTAKEADLTVEKEPNKVKNNSKELRDWGRLPVVQEAMDLFNGYLMEVRA